MLRLKAAELGGRQEEPARTERIMARSRREATGAAPKPARTERKTTGAERKEVSAESKEAGAELKEAGASRKAEGSVLYSAELQTLFPSP